MQGNIIPVVSSRGVKRRSTETPDISPAKQIKKEPEPVPMVNYLILKNMYFLRSYQYTSSSLATCIFEPGHEISNNVVCATSKASYAQSD